MGARGGNFMSDSRQEVRKVLQRFQDGYTARDSSRLDSFMDLFAAIEETEMIGISAAVRGENEWFQGPEQIREIVESDWTYWGDVVLDVDDAKINVLDKVAWLSACGVVVQTDTHDKAMPFYVRQMVDLFEEEGMDPDMQLMEATHFGLRRLRERRLGMGYRWPFVLTAVLVRQASDWRFAAIHWSMPVD